MDNSLQWELKASETRQRFFCISQMPGEVTEIVWSPIQERTLYLHFIKKKKKKHFRNNQAQDTVFKKQKMLPRQNEEKKLRENKKKQGERNLLTE